MQYFVLWDSESPRNYKEGEEVFVGGQRDPLLAGTFI